MLSKYYTDLVTVNYHKCHEWSHWNIKRDHHHQRRITQCQTVPSKLQTWKLVSRGTTQVGILCNCSLLLYVLLLPCLGDPNVERINQRGNLKGKCSVWNRTGRKPKYHTRLLIQLYLVDTDSYNGTYANVGMIKLSCTWILPKHKYEPATYTFWGCGRDTEHWQRVMLQLFIVLIYDLAIAKPALLWISKVWQYIHCTWSTSHHHDLLYFRGHLTDRFWWSIYPYWVCCCSPGFP
jgi:hypothetical protein